MERVASSLKSTRSFPFLKKPYTNKVTKKEALEDCPPRSQTPSPSSHILTSQKPFRHIQLVCNRRDSCRVGNPSTGADEF